MFKLGSQMLGMYKAENFFIGSVIICFGTLC